MKLIFIALIGLSFGMQANAAVKITKNESKKSYDFEITGDDRSSFQSAFEKVRGNIFFNFSEPIATSAVHIYTDAESESFAKGSFFESEILVDPASPYQKRTFSNGKTYLELVVDSNLVSNLSDLYRLINLVPTEKGSKKSKDWISSDQNLIVKCTQYTFPIVASHICIFRLRLEEPPVAIQPGEKGGNGRYIFKPMNF